MCEWLSSREWCDVKIQCGGGRAFSAHRAVLASVSGFLRQIFLSCPMEETTFILLPDFDLEAMSSVLYYVYNGEVLVSKQKIEVFLEIIKALQIFVDEQHLRKLCSTDEGIKVFPKSCTESVLIKTKTFLMRNENCSTLKSINIKKEDKICDILQQYSLSVSDFYDKEVRSQDSSKQLRPCLGNLQQSYVDRQRSCFLRDLYIETYPQNGNVNGRAAGVLAISNELYRAPTSVLLTNANGKHLSAEESLSGARNKATELPLWTNHLATGNPKLLLEDMTNSFKQSNNINEQSSGTKHDLRKIMPLMDFNTTSAFRFENRQSSLSENVFEDSQNMTSKTGLVKSAILNQVLESPWCPRLPNNYRPFRRKIEATVSQLDLEEISSLEKIAIKNDNNNNVNSIEDMTQTISPNRCKDYSDNSSTCAGIVGGEFSCAICNQVFTCSDTLDLHMRRHSTPARYTCPECSKSFSQLRNFKYHMSIHRGTREFAATCTVCGKYFNDKGYLSSHMKIHRNRKEYKCSQCPKSFNQRVAYNMHVRIHTGVKPHVCSACGKAFSRKMLLKQHQRTHSGERPYACPHCDKRFADRSNMTLHLRLHTGVKPFSCTFCPKSFTKKHHLKSHLNFHTGAKPYACPRCKLAFTQSSNMRTHLKKCTVPEPAQAAFAHNNSASEIKPLT